MTYKVSMDRLAKTVTIAVTILFAFIIITQFLFLSKKDLAIPLCTAITLLLIYFLIYGFSPVDYRITNDHLIIHRIFNDVSIAKDQIKSISLISKDKLRWSIRTWGVGGLFGYFGRFANMELGRMTWYATRRDKTVLLVTDAEKKIILTPDDPAAFVAAVESLRSTL